MKATAHDSFIEEFSILIISQFFLDYISNYKSLILYMVYMAKNDCSCPNLIGIDASKMMWHIGESSCSKIL
jgi:hypothetical protein